MAKSNGNAAGDNIRDIAKTIAARAEDVYETARGQIEQIKRETTECVDLLNKELDTLLTRTQEDTTRLAEAANDQLGILAQRVDDVFALCSGAVADCDKHRTLIKGGVTIPALLAVAAETPPTELGGELERGLNALISER